VEVRVDVGTTFGRSSSFPLEQWSWTRPSKPLGTSNRYRRKLKGSWSSRSPTLRAAKLTCLLSRSEPRDLADVWLLERAGPRSRRSGRS